MSTYLSFALYSLVTFLVTILLFPIILVTDATKIFRKPQEMTEEEFMADLYNS